MPLEFRGKQMRERWVLSLLVACLILARPVSGKDTSIKKWSNRVIPLPKEFQIRGSRQVLPRDAVLVMPQANNVLLATAAEILRPLAAGARGFEIKLVLTTEGSECPPDLRQSLPGVPNSDQAYAIRSITKGSKFSGLLLAANTPLGLLYAARTLAQLAPAPSRPQETVEFPEATLLDWPDIADRGQWCGHTWPMNLKWMAERKMNVIQVEFDLGFNDDGSPKVTVEREILDEAAHQGIKVVPIIWHVEQLGMTGIFRFHPNVASTPDPNKPLPLDYSPGLCFSEPQSIEILAGWMREFLALPGISEVMVWVSEEKSPCYCPRCQAREPFEAEVKGIQDAFEKARQGRPGATLQILTTQGSYAVNDKILAAAAPGTKIVYYDGGRTYDSSHRPMIYPLLEDSARSGRWLGVYPQLTNSWRVVFPFTGPQFIRARMNEFADKRLGGMIGYATPSNLYYDFNITATAEWTWNSKGRQSRDFAEAYASRNGMAHPQRYAEWTDLIGEAGWNLAGSRVIERLINPESALFKKQQKPGPHKLNDLKPMQYGKGLFAEFPDREHLDAQMALAARALKLAEVEGNTFMVEESRSVIGALKLLNGLMDLSNARDLPEEKKTGLAQEGLAKIDAATAMLTVSLYHWGMAINPAPRQDLPSRLRDTIDFASGVASLAWEIGRDLGIKDPYPAYRLRPVREWTTEDVSSATPAVLWADITHLLEQPGEYIVRFQFLDGDIGLDTRAAALLRWPAQSAERLVDEDRWNFHVGQGDVWVDYWLSALKLVGSSWKPGDALSLRLETSLPASQPRGGKRSTHGVILIGKSWRDASLNSFHETKRSGQ